MTPMDSGLRRNDGYKGVGMTPPESGVGRNDAAQIRSRPECRKPGDAENRREKGQDPARYPGRVLHRGWPPAGRSFDRIAPPYRGAKMRRVWRSGPAFLPAARPMLEVPCRPPLLITAQRHRRQGFYRGNANDGSTQSARPFSTSCNHGLRPLGFPAGWSFPATPVP